MLELLGCEPAHVGSAPTLPASEDPAVSQEKGRQLLTLLAEVFARRFAGADQIAHRLVHVVGNLDAGQLAGAQETRQCDRVAPVRLHPLSWSLRDQ